jgi:serine protease Do
MKTLLRSVVPLLALFVLIPAARAGSPGEDHPSGWLGLFLDTGAQAADSSPGTEGVRVRGIIEGSPADEARLRANDTIVAVDGTAVTDASQLMTRVREMAPGSFLTLSVKRRGHDLEATPVLGSRPEKEGRWRIVRGRIGVDALEIPSSLRAHFGAPEDAGVIVWRVTEGSPADDAGIRVGDVIYEADGQAVTSLEDLSQIVSEGGVDNTIDVVLARDGARIVVGPTIERVP